MTLMLALAILGAVFFLVVVIAERVIPYVEDRRAQQGKVIRMDDWKQEYGQTPRVRLW